MLKQHVKIIYLTLGKLIQANCVRVANFILNETGSKCFYVKASKPVWVESWLQLVYSYFNS